MFVKKNTVYSEAGHYLKSGSIIGFQLNGDISKFEELPIDINDMVRVGNIIYFNQDKIAQYVLPKGSYDDYKSAIIKKRYSNDDQIAIILNKDNSEEDKLIFDKMQEWRDWASTLANKIVEFLNNN